MRARDFGIPFAGECGPYNAITDVPGVEVGFCTVSIGEPSPDTVYGSDFARTGVTAILPRGKKRSAVFAGLADLNGNGELTGTHWITDSGFMHGPVMITNTNSVGIVRDTVSKWMTDHHYFYPAYDRGQEIPGLGFFYPAVGETYDGTLNNVNGFKVLPEHVIEALDSAKTGPVAEGNVGGGTGMCCLGFKGGTGTASRVVTTAYGERFTIAALVQSNFGTRNELTIKGIPVGRLIRGCERNIVCPSPKEGEGSIIVIFATDAPLLPWQLTKIARRAAIGIGRVGGGNHSGSGDIFLAFSTANENGYSYTKTNVELLSDQEMDCLFPAAAEVVEESILNALVAAEDMYGRNMNFVPALPHDQLKEICDRYSDVFGLW
ncbi:MAG: P1 family peptidase [Clostridia bacterium]|nr:P1 family peptidase [Clostridia bacterium]